MKSGNSTLQKNTRRPVWAILNFHPMPKKILVVDDSITVRQQASLALGAAGYAVVEAVDGQDALDKLAANGDAAMVICDVNMPRLSGLEFVERMRQDGKHATLPVIMLTTEANPSLIDRAKKAGAKAWVTKPCKDDLLVKTVNKIAGPP